MGKEKLLKAFFEEKAVLFGRFVLTSGKESNYYINVKRLSTKGAIFPAHTPSCDNHGYQRQAP